MYQVEHVSANSYTKDGPERLGSVVSKHRTREAALKAAVKHRRVSPLGHPVAVFDAVGNRYDAVGNRVVDES